MVLLDQRNRLKLTTVTKAWIQVGEIVISAYANNSSVGISKDVLQMIFWESSSAEELNLLALGKNFEVTIDCDRSILFKAVLKGDSYLLTPTIRFNEYQIQDIELGYYATGGIATGVKIVESIIGDNQARYLGNGLVELSRNLKGKKVLFRGLARFSRWITPCKDPLPPITAYVIDEDQGSPRCLEIIGTLIPKQVKFSDSQRIIAIAIDSWRVI